MRRDWIYTKNQTKVLEKIVNHGIIGVSNKTIALETGLNRDTVSVICTKLQEDGLIDIQLNGRWRKYRPTEKAIDFQLGNRYATIFKSKLTLEEFFDPYESTFNDLFSLKEKYLPRDFHDLKGEEANLLSFAVRTGIIMTYVLLVAVSPNFVPRIAKDYQIKSKRSIDNLVQEWVKNINSPVDLLLKFSKEFRYEEPMSATSIHEYAEKKSAYQFDERYANRLLATFSQLFPNWFRKLEDIYINLEKDLKEEDIRKKEYFCNHKFKSKYKKIPHSNIDSGIQDVLTSKNFMSEFQTSKGTKEFYCNICGSKRSYFLEQEITDKKLCCILNKLSHNAKLWSPDVFRCKDNRHEWLKQNVPKYELQLGLPVKEIYQCILCEVIIETLILSRNKIKLIVDSVKDKVGENIFTLQILNNIVYHFLNNMNKYYTSDELDYLIPEIATKRSYKDFNKDKEEILKILVESKFILREKVSVKDDTKLVDTYIKKSSSPK